MFKQKKILEEIGNLKARLDSLERSLNNEGDSRLNDRSGLSRRIRVLRGDSRDNIDALLNFLDAKWTFVHEHLEVVKRKKSEG